MAVRERLLQRLGRLHLHPARLVAAAAQQAQDDLHVVGIVLDQQDAQRLPGSLGMIGRQRGEIPVSGE